MMFRGARAMVSSAWAIVLGVVAGVLTSALLALFGSFFKNVTLPWYRAKIYDGVDVAGTWELESFQSDQSGMLELTQQANRLSGRMALVAHPPFAEDYEELRTFTINGFITDRLVELSFRHTDRARIG